MLKHHLVNLILKALIDDAEISYSARVHFNRCKSYTVSCAVFSALHHLARRRKLKFTSLNSVLFVLMLELIDLFLFIILLGGKRIICAS